MVVYRLSRVVIQKESKQIILCFVSFSVKMQGRLELLGETQFRDSDLQCRTMHQKVT